MKLPYFKNKTLVFSAIGIVAVAMLLSAALLALSKASGNAAMQSEPQAATLSEPESEPEQSVPAPASSAESVPAQVSSTAPLPVVTSEYRAINNLSADTVRYLMSLDNTRRGWGQGLVYDSENRPVAAVNMQTASDGRSVRYIMENEKKIYLTFDEGYENGYTSRILDTLREKGVPAVFFVTMPYAKANPDLIRRMINEGHIVGNHSTRHLSFPGMTLEAAYNDVYGLHDYIQQNFGYTMTLFRFPKGESSDRMCALLGEMGYTSLFWSFAYADWDPANQPDASVCGRLLERAHPGALYLLHAVSKTNTEILPRLIDGFREAGYELSAFPVK